MYYRSDTHTYRAKINRLYQCQSNNVLNYPMKQYYVIPGSDRSFTSYPGRVTVLRHTRVGSQVYVITGRVAVLRHTRSRSQIYVIPGSGRSVTSYPGRVAVLRHTRVGSQYYAIPESGRSFT